MTGISGVTGFSTEVFLGFLVVTRVLGAAVFSAFIFGVRVFGLAAAIFLTVLRVFG
jgi:hypothetical protein